MELIALEYGYIDGNEGPARCAARVSLKRWPYEKQGRTDKQNRLSVGPSGSSQIMSIGATHQQSATSCPASRAEQPPRCGPRRLSCRSNRGPRRRPLCGFTIFELLAVITVFAVLLTLLAPALRHAREIARRAVCASNLHSVGLALNMYALDQKLSYFPHCYEGTGKPEKIAQYAYSLKTLFDDYSGGVYKIFDCPNLAPIFEEEITDFFDPGVSSIWEGKVPGQLVSGYQYLAKARHQPPPYLGSEDAWRDGSMMASGPRDPGAVPVFADHAHGGGSPDEWGDITGVDAWWGIVGHLKRGGGFSRYHEWHVRGHTWGDFSYYEIYSATLAGSNHLYVAGHVQWHPLAEMTPKDFQDGWWRSGPPPP